METQLTIRRATPADLTALQELSVQTFSEAFTAGNTAANMQAYMDAAFTSAQLAAELRDDKAVFFFACLGEKVVGYAKLRMGDPPPLLSVEYKPIELQRLYVRAALKGRGVGKQLMETCCRTAREMGYTCLWLGVWEHNPSAIAFYEHCGFRRFSEHIFPFGDEDQIDWLMQKVL